MAQTDNPLKNLVQTSITDFAAWLLDGDVDEVTPLNVEFAGQTVRVDQLFRVVLADGRRTLLHFEFQGRSSQRPMKWRMLAYMAQIAAAEPELDLLSVVFYVGYGAGAQDTGEHHVAAPDGTASMYWHYRVIRLWQMTAQEILTLNRAGLVPLVGQTQLQQPESVLPQVVEQIKQAPDKELQERLFTSLIALLNDEEMTQMVEKLIEDEDLLLDTPFLRRLREKALLEGREEGREEGRKEGALSARREAILDALVWRFDPSVAVYREVEKVLDQVTQHAEIERIFAAVIKAETLADFRAQLSTDAAAHTSKTE